MVSTPYSESHPILKVLDMVLSQCFLLARGTTIPLDSCLAFLFSPAPLLIWRLWGSRLTPHRWKLLKACGFAVSSDNSVRQNLKFRPAKRGGQNWLHIQSPFVHLPTLFIPSILESSNEPQVMQGRSAGPAGTWASSHKVSVLWNIYLQAIQNFKTKPTHWHTMVLFLIYLHGWRSGGSHIRPTR
jgi:hypothetical protein